MRAEESRGRERLKLFDRVELPVRQLQEWHEILRVAGEHGVGMASDRVPGAVGNCEREGLEPGGAALWVCGEEDVVGAWPELGLHEHDAPDQFGREPEALEEEERFPPSFSGRKPGCEALSLLWAAMAGLNFGLSHGMERGTVGVSESLAPSDYI